MALGLSVCMLSLLGFPGTFGFIGKWYILSAVVAEGQMDPRGGAGGHQRHLGGLLSAGHHGDVHEARGQRGRRTREARLWPAAAGAIAVSVVARAAVRRLARRSARSGGAQRVHADADVGQEPESTVWATTEIIPAPDSPLAVEHMNVPKSIFRQYDVRGLVDRELTPEFARALGRAFASVAHERLGRAPVDRRRTGQPALRATRSPEGSGGASPRQAAPR